jgi:hypothetical protein
VERPAGEGDFLAIEQDAIAITRDGGIGRHRLGGGRQLKGVAFDPHFAAAQGVATHHSGIGGNTCAAGEAELVAQMAFLGGGGREAIHAFGDFDQAFPAFALFAAGSGDADAQGFGAVEERSARVDVSKLPIKEKIHARKRE